MIEEPYKIYSEVINVARYGLFIAAYIVLTTCLVGIISLGFGIPNFSLIGIPIAWLAPLLFEKKAKKMFSRKSIISLFNDYFSVELHDRKTESKEAREFRYDEIKSYKVWDSAKDDSTFLKLALKNGGKVSYTFWGQKEGDDENSIVVNLHRCIKSYNETRDEGSKITYAPTFFASKLGTYLFVGLTLFLVSTLIIEYIYKPKAVLVTLGSSAFLYLIILMQWKKDRDQYREMK